MTGLLDIGRYPHGSDPTSGAIADAPTSGPSSPRPVSDIRRWKHRKLLTNLGNVIEAVCGPDARRGALGALRRSEGEVVLAAAGLIAASTEEDRARRRDLLHLGTNQPTRPGGSTWQSLHRHADDIETDYLNGEVVLLSRIHGVPAPANALLQYLARECSSGKRDACSVAEADILRARKGAGEAETDRR